MLNWITSSVKTMTLEHSIFDYFIVAIIFILPTVLAITVHEAAHARMAYQLGDTTAWALGRVSLNPLNHIDWLGTIVVPLSCVIITLLFNAPMVIFGWAKPVPISYHKLRHPRLSTALIAGAGPAANLVMACAWGCGAWLLLQLPLVWHESLVVIIGFALAAAGIIMNVLLMVLNLLPIPPLDGGRIVMSVIPLAIVRRLGRVDLWGLFILIGLVVSGVLFDIIRPIMAFLLTIIPGAGDVFGLLP
jgi:Zn-dependent protease